MGPRPAGELAGALGRAADARQSIGISGAGTKIGGGRRPQRIDATLGMRRLNRVLAHQHGDLTATVEAGATLADVNDALAPHRQCLPLDPPFADRAAIRGGLATKHNRPPPPRLPPPPALLLRVHPPTAHRAPP